LKLKNALPILEPLCVPKIRFVRTDAEAAEHGPGAFSLLNGFIIVRLDRRELASIGVTNSATAEWIE
jgi:hypothetical protein